MPTARTSRVSPRVRKGYANARLSARAYGIWLKHCTTWIRRRRFIFDAIGAEAPTTNDHALSSFCSRHPGLRRRSRRRTHHGRRLGREPAHRREASSIPTARSPTGVSVRGPGPRAFCTRIEYNSVRIVLRLDEPVSLGVGEPESRRAEDGFFDAPTAPSPSLRFPDSPTQNIVQTEGAMY